MRDQRRPTGAVFLDRDGTLIENRHYLGDPAQVALLPGVADAMARLCEQGFALFLLTNQSGIGRGYFSMADAEAVNRRMIEMIGLGEDVFTGICIAPERPDEPAAYRKPSPRYILEMLVMHDLIAARSWMIGDSPSEWEAGIRAGITPVAILAADAPRELRARCEALGITAHGSFVEWVDAVIE